MVLSKVKINLRIETKQRNNSIKYTFESEWYSTNLT